VHHCNSTQNCSTETVFIYIPLPPDQHHILVSKCIPVLMHGLEACPLIKSQLMSLDFAVNRFSMKLFRTSSPEIVKQFQEYLDYEIPSVSCAKRVNKFENKF